ncbi:hypothetical protein [Acinetobacter sp. R933-2]|nr:hypothetical protein [Acinetobacter sp. R933-2]
MKNITILGVWTPALIFAVIHPVQAKTSAKFDHSGIYSKIWL